MNSRLQSELDFAPGSEEVPTGHFCVHCSCPCWSLYVPAGHGLQSVLEDLCMPVGHLAVDNLRKNVICLIPIWLTIDNINYLLMLDLTMLMPCFFIVSVVCRFGVLAKTGGQVKSKKT